VNDSVAKGTGVSGTPGGAVTVTELPGLPPPRRGKVRDVYDLGGVGFEGVVLLVATDRISAYDHVLEPGIPDKGKILTQLSNFWFQHLGRVVRNHLVATDVLDYPAVLRPHAAVLRDRSVLVRKACVMPFECVARGYLAGSGFRDYQTRGRVCGHDLPPGLRRAQRLPEPLFTPATKAREGHDQNVGFRVLEETLGEPLASRLREITLELYRAGADRAAEAGLILADTKFELGFPAPDSDPDPGAEPGTEPAADSPGSIDWRGWELDRLMLVDEVLTPDSSRYWDTDRWQPGTEPDSFDKQYVRNWLDESGWDHESPPPLLPSEVVRGTRERYLEAFRRLTGREPRL
jgi:phosphoribosylaminoimidazole-succinocarboxamide synthase